MTDFFSFIVTGKIFTSSFFKSTNIITDIEVSKLWIKINMSLQCMLNATVLYTTTPNCLSRQRSVARSTPEAAGLVFCSDSESALPRGGISLRWKRWGKHNNKDKLWTIIICYFSRHSHVIQMYIYWNTRHMKSPCKHGKLTSESLESLMLKHCYTRYDVISQAVVYQFSWTWNGPCMGAR